MAISNIPFDPSTSFQVRGREVGEKRLREAGESAAATPFASTIDEVALRGTAEVASLNSMIVERVLSRTEARLTAGAQRGEALASSAGAQDLFAAAGKAEFEARAAAAAKDVSPEATAGRIVEGITGYIFKAYQMQRPEMTEEAFLSFQEQVLTGFEAGLEDAKDILTGLQAMTPELTRSIDRTEELVREQLAKFFETTLESIRENAVSEGLLEA